MTVANAPSPGYTPQQRQAIETRDVSVALSAGAGCGKTFVLTERFLSCFDPESSDALQPQQLGQLVAITFTERAAREMRDRVRQKCYQRLLSAPRSQAGYWAELLRSLDTARISTIHSFCATLLRSRAVEAGLDPQFAVLEQSQSETIFSEILDDQLRRLIAEQDPATIELAVRYDLPALADMVSQLALAAADEQLQAWMQVTPDEQVARWEAFFRRTVVPALARQVGQSPAARELLEIFEEHTPSHAVMAAGRAALLEVLPRLADCTDPRRLFAELDTVAQEARVQGGGTAKSWASAEVYERVKDNAAQLREAVKSAKELLAFDAEAAREAAVLARQVLSIATAVRGAYTARKAELNVLDFGDLLSRARNLLVDPAQGSLRERLSSQIQLLLVDEFQDTDPLQVELVEALCGEKLSAGKLFFVGDHKQSIYRFRGAKPHVFRQLREQTPAAGRQALTLNFRSQPAILEFVNALFWHDLGEGYEPLRPSRPQVSPRTAIEFLWATPASATPSSDKHSLRRCEADWIARRICQMLESGEPIVWDAAAAKRGQPQARPARPGDIALLFRALSDVAVYEQALREYGIDYYVVGGHAFYAQQEIFDLLNMLRAIDSQCDEVSLIGALRSGFFSLSDEALFWLGQHPQGVRAGLLSASHPEAMSEADRLQARFAAATLTWLQAQKDRLPIYELIEAALERTGYDALLLTEFLGERKLANLRKLIEQARGFQRGDFLALSDYIRQLAEFVVRQPDEPLAATHSENTDVVRLMTVHQSKGLEFPIVVVPDLDRPRPNRNGPVHFDAELGPLLRLKQTDDGVRCVSGYDLWRSVEAVEEAAEMNRLLYVATTRAADYLLLSAGVAQAGQGTSAWMKLLGERFDLLTGQLAGPLPAGEPRPEIRVTQEQPATTATRVGRRERIDWDAILAAGNEGLTAEELARPAVDPRPIDRSTRRQFSFSRLAGTLGRRPGGDEPLDSSNSGATDGAGLGTLVHAVLAVVDYHDYGNLPEIVARLAERQSPEAAAHVPTAQAMVSAYLASPRARAVAAAASVHREIEFLLGWPPGARQHATSIGGYLDLLYRDAAGGWHIVDFKTNQLGRGGAAPLAETYEMQMLVYGLAAQQILGVPPQSLTLHFLRTGEEHAFAWDAAARRRAVELVEASLAALAR